jgi:Putative peptidoglycan binding domain
MADVATIQARLNQLGANPPLTVDGQTGPKTKAAIVAFQRANGLDPDGVVGPLTLAALGLSGGAGPIITTAPPSGGKGVEVPAFPGFVKLSRSDQQAFVKAAQFIAPGEPDAAKWLAAIIDFESNRTWSPSVRNATSGATGLIQFLPKAWGAAVAATWPTTAQLAAMSFAQQLEYVKRYFVEITRTQGKIHSLADMYLSVFSPKGVGRSPDTVLYSAGEPGYDQNVGLDHGGKGFITVRDVATTPAARLASVANLAPILVPMGIGLGVFALIGAAALWFFRKKLFM